MSPQRSTKPTSTGRCEVCRGTPVDRCHIKSKGAGGTWDDDNILLMCRTHHQLQHAIGWVGLIARFPILALVLEAKGWEVVSQTGRQRLLKKDSSS